MSRSKPSRRVYRNARRYSTSVNCSASPPYADDGVHCSLRRSADRCRRCALPDRQGRRRQHLLPRGRPGGRARRAAAARLSDLVAHVPQPDPGARRPLPRDRAGLSGLRPERQRRTARSSPTPSTTSPSSSTACSTSSASSATRCTSWTTARRSAGGSRSSIPSGSPPSSSRTAMPTRRG